MGFESILGSVAAPIVGSLLGAGEGSKGSSATQQSQVDPRIAKYIYGEDGTTGIAPAAYDWWQKNQSGVNPQMQQGLDRQWNVFSDPNNAQGYTNMQQLGGNLMGAPVAGNPFTSGRANLMTQGGNTGGLLGGQTTGQQAQTPQFQNPATISAKPPAAMPATTATAPVSADQAGMNAFLAGSNPMAKLIGAAHANGYGVPTAQQTALGQLFGGGQFGDAMGQSSLGAGSFGSLGGLGSSLSGMLGSLGINSSNIGSIAGVLGSLAGHPFGGLLGQGIGGLLGSGLGSGGSGGYGGDLGMGATDPGGFGTMGGNDGFGGNTGSADGGRDW